MLQWLLVAELEVKVVLPPAQIELFPDIIGALGLGVAVTETVIASLETDVQASEIACTVYKPAKETVIDRVVSPLLHKLPVIKDEVSVVEPPWQIVVLPVIVGADNKLTATTFDVAVVHEPLITTTE